MEEAGADAASGKVDPDSWMVESVTRRCTAGVMVGDCACENTD